MFGKRLKLLRDKHNLSQQELGKSLSLAKQTISGYENGTRKPDQDILMRFADYFGVSVDYLLGRTDDPSPRPKIETIAAHRTDDPMDDLPEEARRSVEEFIDYVYKKYGPKKNGEKE